MEDNALMMKALRCCAASSASCAGCPAEATENCVTKVLCAAAEVIDQQALMLAQQAGSRAALTSALEQTQRDLAEARRMLAEAQA